MFGLEYILALVKVFFNLAFAIIMAIPFKFAWNCIAKNYLAPYIPDQFEFIPYWHVVAFILVSVYLGEIIQRLTPKIVNVSQSNDNKGSC